LSTGAAETVNVTGMLTGLFVAVDEVTVTVPWYVPTARPSGFAETVSTAGVLPWLLTTLSQLPPLADAVKESELGEALNVTWAAAGKEPNCW
jgi:hypothetical protein